MHSSRKSRFVDRIMVILSCFFSVYSPFATLTALLIRAQRKGKKIIFLFISLIVIGFFGLIYLFGADQATKLYWAFEFLIMAYVGFHVMWIGLAKRHYSINDALLAYPIHSLLRKRIERIVNQPLKGELLLEIHVNPTLEKQIEKGKKSHKEGGTKIGHAAKQFTSNLSLHPTTVTVIGTTYEHEMAKTMTRAAKKYIQEPDKEPIDAYTLGSKWQHPKKEWKTFVWDIKQTEEE